MTDENFTVESNMGELSSAVAANLIASGVFMPAKKRATHIAWEAKLAREYVEKFYGDNPHWYRIEVGRLPEGYDNAIYTKVRRWADAIVRMPDHMLILEMKMIARPEVSAQLLNYMDLFKETPLFRKYWEEPVKGKVVCAMCDDDTRKFLEKQGIDIELYKPSNYEEWYAKKILKTG